MCEAVGELAVVSFVCECVREANRTRQRTREREREPCVCVCARTVCAGSALARLCSSTVKKSRVLPIENKNKPSIGEFSFPEDPVGSLAATVKIRILVRIRTVFARN